MTTGRWHQPNRRGERARPAPGTASCIPSDLASGVLNDETVVQSSEVGRELVLLAKVRRGGGVVEDNPVEPDAEACRCAARRSINTATGLTSVWAAISSGCESYSAQPVPASMVISCRHAPSTRTATRVPGPRAMPWPGLEHLAGLGLRHTGDDRPTGGGDQGAEVRGQGRSPGHAALVSMT